MNMLYSSLEKLKPYRVTRDSSDGTFVSGDIVWVSENGDINNDYVKGWINPYEVGAKTLDFEVEATPDFEVIKTDGSEICRRVR